MCGLGGFVRPGPPEGTGAGADVLQRLGAALAHRGPDDHGVHLSPFSSAEQATVGLAATRLAIRDRSPAGHMPMVREGITLLFNGEVYNAAPLRDELAAGGWAFRSRSDTEVVLAGYAAWGLEVLTRVRGMFALALHDGRAAGSLLLARDPLGIKPLYWTATGAEVAFASELRALRAAGLLSATVSRDALAAYLLLGSVPAPLTIYEGAHALQPGHLLLVGADGRRELRPYWRLPRAETGPADVEAAAALVRQGLREAVASHLVSDAPIGAFLSGGLDSAAVVALMREAGAGPVRSCSMTVPGHAVDEGAGARRAAALLGSEHHESVVRPDDVVAAAPRIFHDLDQPSIDGLNTWFVSRAAREAGLTVALSGLGGDELFGGYGNTFGTLPRLLDITGRAHRVPGVAALAGAALSAAPTQRWRKVAEAIRRPPGLASGYLAVRGLFAPGEVLGMLRPDSWDRASGTAATLALLHGAAGQDEYPLRSRIARLELSAYTPWQLLRDADVMSMAHGLEVRVPLLDTRLVETVLGIPAAVRYQGNGSKPLLRKALEGVLPAGIATGPKKGFTLPLDVWLRDGLAERLPGGQAELPPPFRPGVMEEARAMLGRGRLHWSRLWALVALRAWWQVSEAR